MKRAATEQATTSTNRDRPEGSMSDAIIRALRARADLPLEESGCVRAGHYTVYVSALAALGMTPDTNEQLDVMAADALEQATERCRSAEETVMLVQVGAQQALDVLVVAHRKQSNDSDYCYVCDRHPSSGHGERCPIAPVKPVST